MWDRYQSGTAGPQLEEIVLAGESPMGAPLETLVTGWCGPLVAGAVRAYGCAVILAPRA